MIRNPQGLYFSEVNAAQYQIRAGWYGSCGQISLAAILRLTEPGISANDVVSTFRTALGRSDPNYTFAYELARLINEIFAESWEARVDAYSRDGSIFSEAESPFGLPLQLARWLGSTTYIIPLVEIVSGSSAREIGGQAGKTDRVGDGIIRHWVVITGMSRQWDYSDPKSIRNWVRIFNPFDNQTEYYLWEDFRAAWRHASAYYRMVLVQRKWAEDDPLAE